MRNKVCRTLTEFRNRCCENAVSKHLAENTFTFMGLVWLCSMHNGCVTKTRDGGGGRSYPGSLYHSDRRTWALGTSSAAVIPGVRAADPGPAPCL